MKKIVTLLLLGLFSALSLGQVQVAANETLIDVYPYDNIGCMTIDQPCTTTRVGTSNWTLEYNGYRYHAVRGAVRYVKDFDDANADGFISPLEMMSALSWPSFGGIIINDTDDAVTLSTASLRTDLTGVVHRIYSYFDAAGVIQMFEDHFFTYHIYNDGTLAAPDWRLATAAEAAAHDASVTAGTVDLAKSRLTQIRMIRNAQDSNGYVLEPLTYLTWRNPDAGPDDNGSILLDRNPDFVHIPAGWTVFSFSTFDRGSFPKPVAFLRSLPAAFENSSVAPMRTHYEDQPAAFDGITALDNDLVLPGVQIVVDFNGTFTLPTNITSTWLNMFDDDGKIIASQDRLDYEVVIQKDGVDLETIKFNYNATTNSYTQVGSVTSIDTTEFGAVYTAKFSTVTPKNDRTEVEVDIVIGVMPPFFKGVANRFVDEGRSVDLLQGITADDGYGVDISQKINVILPDGFNQFSPLPGQYKIDVTFDHDIFIEGVEAYVELAGTKFAFNPAEAYNQDININTYQKLSIFDNIEHFTTSTTGFGSVIVVVDAQGKLKERYDRYNWRHTTSTGTVVGDATLFAQWQANLVLLPGEFIVAGHGSVHGLPLRETSVAGGLLDFGSPVSFEVGVPEVNFTFEVDSSYILTVDDTTAPVIIPIRNKSVIEIGEFTSVNEAILANVVAFDNFSTVATYVSKNGGLNLSTVGTYNVEVTAEDEAGNTSVASFQVQVVAPKLTENGILGMIEANTLSQADIQALIDAAVEAALEAFEDQQVVVPTPEVESGVSLLTAIIIALASSSLSLVLALLILKKK
jgi:hypothetical protein